MGEAEAALVDEKQVDLGVLPNDESVIWSQEVEVCLFHAMLGHKPVGEGAVPRDMSAIRGRVAAERDGVNRHFHMICIREKFSQNIGRQVSSKVIWDHLGTMYDMQALDESEILPFPNSEKCFVLPEEIIQEVKEGKLELEQESKEDIKEERDSPSTYEEGSAAPARVAERSGSRDKDRDVERGSAEGVADKRKRHRAGADKALVSNGNPSSPSGTKRRRT